MNITPILLRTLGGLSLVAVGVGVQRLMHTPREPRRIKSWNFEDKGRILNINPTSGQWTRVNEYQDKTLFNKCIRTTSSSEENCYDYLETKASKGHPIKLFGSEGEVNRNMKGWDIYKFIYRDNIETKYGVCMPIEIEGPNNPCSHLNLPKGWSKEYVSKIPTDTQ